MTKTVHVREAYGYVGVAMVTVLSGMYIAAATKFFCGFVCVFRGTLQPTRDERLRYITPYCLMFKTQTSK